MSFAATWMEVEAIILSEVTPDQKPKYHMFSLLSDSWTMGTQKQAGWDNGHWTLRGREGVKDENLPTGHNGDYWGDRYNKTLDFTSQQFIHITKN